MDLSNNLVEVDLLNWNIAILLRRLRRQAIQDVSGVVKRTNRFFFSDTNWFIGFLSFEAMRFPNRSLFVGRFVPNRVERYLVDQFFWWNICPFAFLKHDLSRSSVVHFNVIDIELLCCLSLDGDSGLHLTCPAIDFDQLNFLLNLLGKVCGFNAAEVFLVSQLACALLARFDWISWFVVLTRVFVEKRRKFVCEWSTYILIILVCKTLLCSFNPRAELSLNDGLVLFEKIKGLLGLAKNEFVPPSFCSKIPAVHTCFANQDIWLGFVLDIIVVFACDQHGISGLLIFMRAVFPRPTVEAIWAILGDVYPWLPSHHFINIIPKVV